MKQKISLTPDQKTIFLRLSENKIYEEIATELEMDVEDVESKVNSVFSLAGCENITKKIVKIDIFGEQFN